MNAGMPVTRGAASMPAFAPLFVPGTESVTVRWLSVVYPVDAAVPERVLPAPLDPSDRSEVIIWVAEFIGASFTSPAGTVETRPSYMQGGVDMRCSFEGSDGAYALGTYVEGLNHGILGRELFGLPKKQSARVRLEDYGEGVEFELTDASSTPLVTGRAPTRAGSGSHPADITPRWFDTQYTVKLIPSAEGNAFDVSKLVRVPFHLQPIGPLRTGVAELEFIPSRRDPIQLLEPAGPAETTYGHAHMTIDYGTYVAEVDPSTIPVFGTPSW